MATEPPFELKILSPGTPRERPSTPPEPPFLRLDTPLPRGAQPLRVLRGVLADGEEQEARWHRRNELVRARIARMERQGSR